MTSGFTGVPNWLIRDVSLSPRAILTYLVIASRADRAGECEMSVAELARETSASSRTVHRYLDELREVGAVISKAAGPSGLQFKVSIRMDGPLESLPPVAEIATVGSADLCQPVHESLPLVADIASGHCSMDLEGLEHTASADALFDVETPKPEVKPSSQHLVAAWVDGYRETHAGEDPHEYVVKQVAGHCKRLANSCTSTESWRDAWYASKEAGRRNIRESGKMLGGGSAPPKRADGVTHLMNAIKRDLEVIPDSLSALYPPQPKELLA